MTIKVNSVGISNAGTLIKNGKVDKNSSWGFSASDGDNLLEIGRAHV